MDVPSSFRSARRASRRRGTRHAPLLLLALACASTERPDLAVRSVHWEGVTAVPRASLEAVVRTRRSSRRPFSSPVAFDAGTLEADRERVVEVYRQAGFYHAEVRAHAETDPSGDAVDIHFEVEEGDPTTVARRSITVVGPDRERSDPRWPDDLEEGLPGGVGAVFALEDYREAKREVLRRFGEAGFPDAALSGGAQVDLEGRRAEVDWAVEPGTFVTMGSVEVLGLEHTDEGLVREVLDLTPGEVLRPSRLESAREHLLALEVFRTVAVTPVRPGEGDASDSADVSWPIEVRVEEREPRTVSVGLGYATDEHIRGRLGWEHRNLLRSGRVVGVEGRASFIDLRARSWLRWHRLFDRETTGTLGLELRRRTLESYDAESALIEFELARPLAHGWTGALGYSYDWTRTDNVSDETEDALDHAEGIARFSILSFSLGRDTSSSPTEPTRGSRIDLRLDWSPRVLGSDVAFLRSEVHLRRYWPLGVGVLAGRLRLGVLAPYGPDDAEDVPLVQRYFAGGGDSVRGYEYQHVGPRDAGDDPIGGTNLALAGLEWRFPLWKMLSGVVFADAGQVNLQPFQWSGSDTRFGVGGGLRFGTPVGPVRIDLGVPVNRPSDDPGVQVHLSIGHTF